MEGVLYKTDNFPFFKDMMRLRHSEKCYRDYAFFSDKLDFYDKIKYQVIIEKRNNVEKVLVIPTNGELSQPNDMEAIKSLLERITKSKLTEVKSNGN